MIGKSLVIAGNYSEFRALSKNNHDDFHEDFIYLSKLPDDIRGRESTYLFLTGTYYNRTDFNESEIRSYCTRHFIKIIYREPLYFAG
jgi:hypothetical protein